MSEQRPKPVPVVDELSAPFWNAAREHRLVVQRCADCNYYNHPPKPFCDACLSQRLEFQAVSGRGTIYSFTVMHQRDVAGFEHEAPFINIVVELAEQSMLLMVSNQPIGELGRLRAGAQVEVWFENRGVDLVIPQFRII
ncbi:MAG: Zn-ribbon domain-containing OB-fold protein [Gammaproteobacteria bacterium]